MIKVVLLALICSLGLSWIILHSDLLGNQRPASNSPEEILVNSATLEGGYQRYRLYVLKDYQTGCQYLVTNSGGPTPRLRADGSQICD